MIVLLATVIMIAVIFGMYVIDWNYAKDEVQAIWTKDERGHYICGAKLFTSKKRNSQK